jgi:DNA invertase Pin-like site-specific DNA recombinase
MNAKTIVAYYRVSTRQQARSGLGLLAQQDAIRRYVAANRCKVLAELTEVESGRDNGRPKLAEALWFCRVYDAKLVIARLDRLARSTAMIAGLMKSGVDFVAADMPLANRFTIHILSAVAEYEARLISERTKAAFAAAKARGRKFGNPDPTTHRFSDAARRAQVHAIRERAKTRALDYLPLLCELRERGETIHGIALQLTEMHIETPRGRAIWRDRMVTRLFEYAGERKPKPWAVRRTAEVRRSMHSDLPTLPTRPAGLLAPPDLARTGTVLREPGELNTARYYTSLRS